MKDILMTLLALLLGLPVAVVLAGQLGLFKGAMPGDLGVKDGRLKPPSRTPNSVSSQAALYGGDAARGAQIDPIAFTASGPNAGAETLTRIGRVVLKMPGARILRSGPDYLYVQFQTRWLKFVDDAEFAVIPGENVVHVRSASRIGRKDFGVNRARIESIRAALREAP